MNYSYDIFDTCLIRSCDNPHYVFDILGREILGADASTNAIMDFTLERIRGEQEARQTLIKDNCEDINIYEIYNFCDFTALTNIHKDQIIEKELEIERRVLVPVYTIKKEIEKIHERGQHVFFISDMYLPFDFIQNVLEEKGLYNEGDKIYISGCIRKSKNTGNLYKYVQNENNLIYKDWLHQGDNWHSDINIPQQYGIRTKHINHLYTYYESLMNDRDCSSSFMNRKKLAAISKSVRLLNENNSHIIFASDFIAPIYVPFVCNILKEAEQRQISDLYFIARDGYIFYIIANELKELFPNINLHYLYASRKSLYLPSIDNITEENIAKMFFFIDNIDIKDVLDQLQLPNYQYDETVYKTIKGRKVIASLLTDEEFRLVLNKKIAEQRNLALQYFIQEGMDSGNNAIVDLTGTRKCHIAINNILKSGNIKPVYGFYLECMKERIKGTNYTSLTCDERYKYNNRNLSLRPHELFEQYFSITNQLRTASYKKVNDEIKPVFENEDIDIVYKNNVFNINKMVCTQFANQYKIILKQARHKELALSAISIYSWFCYAPRIEYLEAIKDFKISDSCIKSKKLLYKCSIIKAYREKKHIWREAQLVYNSPFPWIMTKWLEYKLNRTFIRF